MAGRTSNGLRPTDHGTNEPEGKDDGSDGKNAADHGADVAFGKSRDAYKRVNGDADGAESDGSGIGDEVEGGGLKGLEAETDHEGAGDSDGGAEASAAFDERAEAKSYEEELQAAVGSDGRDGLLHDFKLAGVDGDVVEIDGSDDDPDDFEKAVGGAVEEAGDGQLGGHVEDEDGAQDGSGGAGDGAKVNADFETGEQAEKDEDGKRSDESGKPPVVEWVVDLRPGQGKASAK